MKSVNLMRGHVVVMADVFRRYGSVMARMIVTMDQTRNAVIKLTQFTIDLFFFIKNIILFEY